MQDYISKHKKIFVIGFILAFVLVFIPALDRFKYAFFDNVHRAAEDRSTIRLEKVLPKTKDIDGRDKHGKSALQEASAILFDINIARFLIKHGANVNQKSKEGVPLITEILLNQKYNERKEQMMSLFMVSGADINATDSNGNTPLIAVTASMPIEILNLVIKYNPEINALNNSGETALYKAVMKGDIRAARVLLENNADCNLVTKSGNTLWDIVNASKKFDFVALLKKYNAKSTQQVQPENSINTSK
ncbi:MAG: ankyrin repeat domain-containing protein [Victivallaceae bacterium]